MNRSSSTRPIVSALNADGLPVAQSIIANNDLQITLRYEMLDTVTGVPMGVTPASATGLLPARPS